MLSFTDLLCPFISGCFSETGYDENATDALIPNPVAIIGVPGGMEVRHDQLREQVAKGMIDDHEVRGRETVLYFRGMK